MSIRSSYQLCGQEEREREQKKTSGVNFSVWMLKSSTSSVMFNRRTSNSSKNSLRGHGGQ